MPVSRNDNTGDQAIPASRAAKARVPLPKSRGVSPRRMTKEAPAAPPPLASLPWDYRLIPPRSINRACSIEYRAQGWASSRARLMGLPVPSQMP